MAGVDLIASVLDWPAWWNWQTHSPQERAGNRGGSSPSSLEDAMEENLSKEKIEELKKKMVRMAEFLIDGQVRSFSPETGVLLVGVADEIKAIMATAPEDLRDTLQRYVNSLNIVAVFGAFHQKGVMDKFELLVEAMQQRKN